MLRRTLITIIALGLLVCFAAMAHADGYTVVNKTVHKLWIQSKALKAFNPATKNESFFLAKGKSKTLNYGNQYNLSYVKISVINKDLSYTWNRDLVIGVEHQTWRMTVTIENKKLKVEKVKN